MHTALDSVDAVTVAIAVIVTCASNAFEKHPSGLKRAVRICCVFTDGSRHIAVLYRLAIYIVLTLFTAFHSLIAFT
jgi:hypothetical protein